MHRPPTRPLLLAATAVYAAASVAVAEGPIQDFESFPLGSFGTSDSDYAGTGYTLRSAWGVKADSIGNVGGNRALGVTNPPASDTIVPNSFFSPVQPSAFGVAALDVRIDSLPTSNDTLNLRVQSGSAGAANVNTIIRFDNDGTLDVLQVVDGATQYADDVATFDFGVPFQLGVETLPDGTLNVYKEAVNVFSGTEINFGLGLGAATPDQLVGSVELSTNDGRPLVGSFDATFDNFSNTLRAVPVPEPGGLAVFALAGLGLRRRRRPA